MTWREAMLPGGATPPVRHRLPTREVLVAEVPPTPREAVAVLDEAFVRALAVATEMAEEVGGMADPEIRKAKKARLGAAAVVIGAWSRIMAGTGRRPLPETQMTGPLAGPSVEQLEERDRQARALLEAPSPELREALEEAGWVRGETAFGGGA